DGIDDDQFARTNASRFPGVGRPGSALIAHASLNALIQLLPGPRRIRRNGVKPRISTILGRHEVLVYWSDTAASSNHSSTCRVGDPVHPVAEACAASAPTARQSMLSDPASTDSPQPSTQT